MEWNELLDRNIIATDKKLLIFVLSFLASSLILVTNMLSETTVAIIFLIPFTIFIIALWVLVRQPSRERWRFQERKLLQSRWGAFGISALGFGLGGLIYHNRAWFIWLWYEFRKIDKPDEWLLVSLFLLGVMLGVFIVRNWSKDQKDFITSLTAVFGAAFVSTILGQLSSQSGSVLTPQNTFAFYALGFTLSGALNLIAFALLVAHYTRTESLTSRSVIDFLYGSDKAQAIDQYFLKNFEADPNYAKAKLVTALSAYREIIRKELARQLNKRKDRSGELTSPPHGPSDGSIPLDYFELLSIKSVQPKSSAQMSPPTSPPSASPSHDGYEIVFRRLREKRSGQQDDPITSKMFRVAISMRWLDNLEYVVTAGEYLKPFPYFGSVAGMSLLVRKTIIMDKDKDKKFRTSDFMDGKTPSQADQPRGLYDIDYLSYICVPMASSLGKPEEQSLGVLHASTKLFACLRGKRPSDSVPVKETVDDAQQEIFKIVVEPDKDSRKKLDEKLRELESYARNLYEQNDPLVTYLEDMRDVIIPLLELYKKCRTGVVKESKPAA
ncbi:MAG: hypothetical protein WCB68_07425 [Pyrinomonadaceae bacterium]